MGRKERAWRATRGTRATRRTRGRPRERARCLLRRPVVMSYATPPTWTLRSAVVYGSRRRQARACPNARIDLVLVGQRRLPAAKRCGTPRSTGSLKIWYDEGGIVCKIPRRGEHHRQDGRAGANPRWRRHGRWHGFGSALEPGLRTRRDCNPRNRPDTTIRCTWTCPRSGPASDPRSRNTRRRLPARPVGVRQGPVSAFSGQVRTYPWESTVWF